ncbi:MAG: DUF1592 domain-containing protein, partial [Planctomycetes bacterium]|nr:DUF1592 domain-containing protein [Planctomycetota bacterium]
MLGARLVRSEVAGGAVALGVLGLLLASPPNLAGQAAEPTRDQGADARFTQSVQPLLKKYCFGCHGAENAEGQLRLDRLAPDFVAPSSFSKWKEVQRRVGSAGPAQMPPRDEPQPAPAEVRTLQEWISGRLTAAAEAEAAQQKLEGRAPIRRLNNLEYNNTLNDLLGVTIDIRSILPEDEIVAGFDNVGAGLQITRIHQERYLEAAEIAVNAALPPGARPKTETIRATLRKDGYPARKPLSDETMLLFTSVPAEIQKLRPAVAGTYRIRLSAYAHGTRGAPLVVGLTAGNPAAPIEEYFSIPDGDPTVIELEVPLAPGQPPIKIAPYGFGNFYVKDPSTFDGPGLALEWIELEGPLVEEWPPASQRALIGTADLKKLSLAEAEAAVRSILPRAFRRTVSPEKSQKYLEFLRATARPGKGTVEEALRQTLTAILCSPDFLLLYEQPGPLDDYALASRLSYFLWRTMPDATLLDVASHHKLKSPDELRRQVERMLEDPKARVFPAQFLGQWLGLRLIDATTPDKVLYPEYDSYLRYSMLQEPQRFFAELLSRDLSVLNFVDSEFLMLNDRLATHYGLPAVAGPEFRKVNLPADRQRGGVLTMAGVLKVTANGTITSPVIRGSWVLTNLVGQPVELPTDLSISAVEPDIRGARSIREQLAKHRKVTQCASCHERLDPPGFALENFDPIGGYRTSYRAVGTKAPKASVRVFNKPVEYAFGLKVDAGDVLPNGKRFHDAREYKQLLLEDPAPVVRTVTEKLVVYATGCPIRPTDGTAIEAIVGKIQSRNYGLRSLVHEIVQSD